MISFDSEQARNVFLLIEQSNDVPFLQQSNLYKNCVGASGHGSTESCGC